ncbi:AhpC/TSA family protein [bacterium]|nr:AhpC/TSA family protein [bacterium]
MKKIVLALILVITLINCGNETGRIVEGNIQSLSPEANQKVYIFKLNDKSLTAVDSAVIDKNGDFKIELQDSNNGIFHFGSSMVNTLPIVINQETKNIELDIKNGQQLSLDYTVKGSEESQQMALFYKRVYGMMKFNQEISMKMKQISPDNFAGQEILQKESMEASQEFIKFRNQFIEDNKDSEALIVVIDQIRPESEFDLLKTVTKNLSKTLPNSAYTNNLNQYINQIEQEKINKIKMATLLEIGNEAPELDFPNPEGTNIKLSSLRGKVVLLDFWASWCKPCRMENPNVVNLYNKYKESGFDVYSFSLDTKKENWMKAIQADGLVWGNHVSDLKGWKSESVSIYGFGGIPFTVLIGRDGKIIAKNLRGAALEKALLEVL